MAQLFNFHDSHLNYGGLCQIKQCVFGSNLVNLQAKRATWKLLKMSHLKILFWYFYQFFPIICKAMHSHGKSLIKHCALCLKITQKVAFSIFHFRLFFTNFCPILKVICLVATHSVFNPSKMSHLTSLLWQFRQIFARLKLIFLGNSVWP